MSFCTAIDAIEVSGLVKTFRHGKVKAVDGVSFTVKKGEIFGLLGVNGAGKTTTINILTGILKKDKGEIRILGMDPRKDWEEVKPKMNVSTAYYPLSDVLTIRQNLRVYAGIYHVKEPKKKIEHLLEIFELKHLGDRKVRDLSSGEKTRTALCKGLINDPEILFLDECTVGLDPDIAEKTRNIIKEYNKKKGCTIIFTSHYMYEVEELCDRIAFMSKGKIITIATADELKKTIKKQTIAITVKSDVHKLKKFLEDEKVDILTTEDNNIIFEVSSENDKIYKTLNKIFANGFMLQDLHIKRPTLEEIFIKFARSKK